MIAQIRDSINALVLGVGRFGRHHARILSQLNRKNQADVPRIDRLIVSCTGMERARQAATVLRRDRGVSVSDIIPVVIAHAWELKEVMARYSPRFVAITARDKTRGDTIHGDYARIALQYGMVLCEKPFASATGNGTSLIPLKKLTADPKADGFGLELPMAVAFKELRRLPNLYQRLLKARLIRFYWHGPTRTNTELIDDLVLHPWSLLPEDLEAQLIKVDSQPKQAFIHLQLLNPATRKKAVCFIALYRGGTFRAIEFEDITVSFRVNAGDVELFQLATTPNQPNEEYNSQGTPLLTVENPVEQHIVNALKRKPIVGLERTYRSQFFLEKLHGHQGGETTFRLT